MSNDDERIEFKDLSDSEKAQRMRESASSMKDFGSKKDYYSPKVHRDDEEYYLQLLNEGRKTECRLYGYNLKNWEKQKYLSRLINNIKIL